VVAAYAPPRRDGREEDANAMAEHLIAIQALFKEARRCYGSGIDIIVAGDFNRHDVMWGGNHIAYTNRQGKAKELV